MFLWFDFWVGFYLDRPNRTLYFCPLPCVVFRFRQKPETTRTPPAVETGRLRASISVRTTKPVALNWDIKKIVEQQSNKIAQRIHNEIFTGNPEICSYCRVNLSKHLNHLSNCRYYENLDD